MGVTADEQVDVAVVGAGLAGQAAAAVAADAASSSGGGTPRVALVDSRSPGGRARTDERDGFRFNQGPHALYRGGEGRRVLGRLGIVPAGGAPAVTAALGRRGDELVPLPGTPRQLVTSPVLGLRSKARLGTLLARLPRVDVRRLASMSAATWIDDLDLADDARSMVEMLMRVATYCDDFDACSADAAVGQLQMALADGVDYLDHGWQQLVDGLLAATTARGVRRVPAGRVEEVRPDETGAGWIVRTVAGELRARSVVLAVGSPAATAAVFAGSPEWSVGPDLTAACLDLGLASPPDPPLLFGLDRPLYLSTHCPPATLAPAGRAVVHVLRYGARAADVDAPELWEHAAAAGITDADVVTHRFLSHMVVAHGLPRPGLGLVGRPHIDDTGAPGLFVAGDWIGPVGMLADASLSSGEQAGRAAVAYALGAPTAAMA
jgi:phytoene dehydrogenase-like protein